MTEHKPAELPPRFTAAEFAPVFGGYVVRDRRSRVATFVDEGMAIQYAALLNALPQLANSCEACRPPPRKADT